MKNDRSKTLLLILSLGGLAFSGYLSAVKLFTKTCAFNESCPYFLGYPACYYGFTMYLLLTIFSALMVTDKLEIKKSLMSIGVVSFLGVIFAGYFTFKELPVMLEKGLKAYILGLPTCALGLIFYTAIFLISVIHLRTIEKIVRFDQVANEKNTVQN